MFTCTSQQNNSTRKGFIFRVRHEIETFSALLALCEGNPPVTGGFPSQRPATRSFDVFFDLRLNKQPGKQSRRWWFEMPSRLLWRHCNVYLYASSRTQYVNDGIHGRIDFTFHKWYCWIIHCNEIDNRFDSDLPARTIILLASETVRCIASFCSYNLQKFIRAFR